MKTAVMKAIVNNRLEKMSLTMAQREIVIWARDKVLADDGSFYSNPMSAKEGRAFQAKIADQFSKKDGAEIFERLDPDILMEVTGITLLPKVDNIDGDCSCSTFWTFCEGSASCSTTCYGCVRCVHVIECGPFGGFECNGKCALSESDIAPPKVKN